MLKKLLVVLFIFSFLLSACAPAATPIATVDEPVVEAPATEVAVVEPTAAPVVEPTEAPVVPAGPNAELTDAKAGKYAGTTVTIMGPYTAEDDIKFRAAMEPFIASTGINVEHEGTADFNTLLTVRVEAGNAPDLAVVAQPATTKLYAEQGKLVDLSSVLDMDQVKEDYIQDWIDLGTFDGKLYGIYYRASTKSLVWYMPAEFEAAGYAVPTSWEEMVALQDQIIADGKAPWCISIEHSGVTGWVATDWLEEIVLRKYGPEVYDQWVNHEIPFNAPEIVDSLEEMGKIWKNDAIAYGGKDYILNTWVGATQNPMFETTGTGEDQKLDSKCFMHRQAGWYLSFIPETQRAASNFFYFPAMDEKIGKPILGAGDQIVQFNDRPEVRALVQYLSSPEGGKIWAMTSGFISANKNVPLDWYGNALDRSQAEILQNATIFRFDASDMMPAEVGSGSFWTGMIEWTNGKDSQTVLDEIEASWPK
ncbi:MAG: ABC transporter substrate-binding protein [Chloroflexi bacterium HGW-Chloroflexi-10]|nr:MAG: ABC transporter substrate-binding protein [Chloroflexi bacterium HGW-Chloroflexi-10]